MVRWAWAFEPNTLAKSPSTPDEKEKKSNNKRERDQIRKKREVKYEKRVSAAGGGAAAEHCRTSQMAPPTCAPLHHGLARVFRRSFQEDHQIWDHGQENVSVRGVVSAGSVALIQALENPRVCWGGVRVC
jgi:hypothetical protein